MSRLQLSTIRSLDSSRFFVHESYGSAALCGGEPDAAEHLRYVPLHGRLGDLGHVA